MQQFGLKENEIKALRAVFASIPEVEEAVVYGSRARMTNRISSDIDITLKGKDLTYTQLALADDMIDSLFLPYFVDLSLFSSLKNQALLDNIEADGKLLFVRNS